MPTTSYRLPTTDYLLPTTYPTDNYLLLPPAGNYYIPPAITYYYILLLPTATYCSLLCTYGLHVLVQVRKLYECECEKLVNLGVVKDASITVVAKNKAIKEHVRACQR